MGKYKIAVIPGDGVGPEVIWGACEVLNEIGRQYNHGFEFVELLAGGSAIDAVGVPLPEVTLKQCQQSDSVLLGAVGGTKWDTLAGNQRPEQALLGLRAGLGLYANLRPAVLLPQLASASPLKMELVQDGIDIMIVRELIGGIYFGDRGIKEAVYLENNISTGEQAFDTESYNEMEIRRIAEVGFRLAGQRKKRLLCVDKANILETSRLWRKVINQMTSKFPDIIVDYMYVDNASMQLIKRPKDFDVMITTNMFGDILSDEAGMITGSIGMLPSASLGEPNTPGLYEPVHGSAPDIAGQDKVNPLAAILSAAMMLRWSLHLGEEALSIEKAVHNVLDQGFRTFDIAYQTEDIVLGTKAMTQKVLEALKQRR